MKIDKKIKYKRFLSFLLFGQKFIQIAQALCATQPTRISGAAR
jgi:hypothetical protein